MFARLLLVLLCTAVWAGSALAQEFPPDRVFNQIAANRPAYGRAVFIFGDSVAMMCSLEEIDFSTIKEKINDPDYIVSAMATLMRTINDPGEKANDPLWPMHSVASAMNSLFAASGLLTTDDGGATIPAATVVAAYAGALGLPFAKDVAARAAFIRERIDAGVIRDGDVVVFEDAGFHGQDPDAYADNLMLLGRTLRDRVDVTLVLMDMFDAIPEEKVMGLPPEAFRFEAPYPSPRSGGQRSHNQVIRETAARLSALPDGKGRVVLLPMRSRMDAFRTALSETLGAQAIMPEGIHPTPWGEAFLVREILRGADLAPLLTDREPYLALLAANAARLSQPRHEVDPTRARPFIDAWLAP